MISLLNKTDRDITNARINYKKLASTVIEYNILNSDKDEINGIGTMLAPAVINKTKKTWIFSFPPNIVQWVQDPASFVFLDITTQERFNSKYSQALWEICIGSLENQCESYFSVTLEECRMLMSGKENSQVYKDFKRRVILVAINEINEKSILYVELFKELKEGRRVTELVFFVKKQENIEIDPLVTNEKLFKRMTEEFGITTNIAVNLIGQYDDGTILRNLDYTEQQYRKAIKNKKAEQFNLGAYAASAITKDYAPKQPRLISKVVAEKEQNKQKELNILIANKAERDSSVTKIASLFEKIHKSLQDSLKKEFENNGMRGPIKKAFEKDGWSNEQNRKHLYIYIASQIEQGRKGQGYDQINELYNSR